MPTAEPRRHKSDNVYAPGVRVHYFLLLAVCQTLSSSPVNGSSEGRRQMANVGIHSYISTKPSSTLSERLYDVTLQESYSCMQR